ncbi:MAG: NUDIX hydrolase [Candidatus Levybacteria bacterium]|nr:NUDIX hydrolase [Candidatus Levybacteria bacterium]
MLNTNKPLDKYNFCPNCKEDLISELVDGDNRKRCENCGLIFWNNPKPVVSIVLEKDGKILMLQRSKEPFKDYWVLPGGFIKYEETAQQAIKRETKEEAGIEVEISGIIGTYRIDDDLRGIHIDIIFYGKPKGEIKLNEEDRSWKYFSPDSLPENIAYKHRNAIEDYKKTSLKS